MNANSVNDTMAAIHRCAMAMMENGAFIQEELPGLSMGDDFRASIKEVCASLIGTKHDVVHELFELQEEIEAGVGDAKVLSKFDRMFNWIQDDLSLVDELVQRIDAAADEDPALGIVRILVMESALNILNAFNEAKDAKEKMLASG